MVQPTPMTLSWQHSMNHFESFTFQSKPIHYRSLSRYICSFKTSGLLMLYPYSSLTKCSFHHTSHALNHDFHNSTTHSLATTTRRSTLLLRFLQTRKRSKSPYSPHIQKLHIRPRSRIRARTTRRPSPTPHRHLRFPLHSLCALLTLFHNTNQHHPACAFHPLLPSRARSAL